MSKVQLTKEQAGILEHLINEENYTFESFMGVFLDGKFQLNKDAEVLNSLSINELASALINGYDIKLSPIEKWNNNIKHIKSSKKACDGNEIYSDIDLYELELDVIKSINEDFGLGLDV